MQAVVPEWRQEQLRQREQSDEEEVDELIRKDTLGRKRGKLLRKRKDGKEAAKKAAEER